MGGIALLARQAGHTVTGMDKGIYPPMSTQLEAQGIDFQEGYTPETLPEADAHVVGNVMTRGNPVVEHILEQRLAFTSGPQWLYENVLRQRWVLAVAGTHGKTTTASILAWILEYAGLKPGFLIGGIPENFQISARLGESPFFVVEADEYDTAFFDKRSKFVHYYPRTLILNNLEYDHADIFPDLAAIQRQFHHLLRIVPEKGLIVSNAHSPALDEVIEQGCWTPCEHFGESGQWSYRLLNADGSAFELQLAGESQGIVQWSMLGLHNVNNALAAIAAARHAGVPVTVALAALAEFKGVKRRMQLRGEAAGIRVYDDFAHHPTAIQTTVSGLKANISSGRIFAILEPRSNTMKLGVHRDTLASSLQEADNVFLYASDDMPWQAEQVLAPLGDKAQGFNDTERLIQHVVQNAVAGDHLLVMSNGSFENLHERLLTALRSVHHGH